MAKIKVNNPVVNMNGDEMTRIIWDMIIERLLEPVVEEVGKRTGTLLDVGRVDAARMHLHQHFAGAWLGSRLVPHDDDVPGRAEGFKPCCFHVLTSIAGVGQGLGVSIDRDGLP